MIPAIGVPQTNAGVAVMPGMGYVFTGLATATVPNVLQLIPAAVSGLLTTLIIRGASGNPGLTFVDGVHTMFFLNTTAAVATPFVGINIPFTNGIQVTPSGTAGQIAGITAVYVPLSP